jgi:hypothetical protein
VKPVTGANSCKGIAVLVLLLAVDTAHRMWTGKRLM